MRVRPIAAIIVVVSVGLFGCAAPYLMRVDSAGRDPAVVEADKLACSQHAQKRLTWSEFAVGVFLGPAGAVAYQAQSDEFKLRQRRIEQAGEECMVSRGYRLKAE